MNISITELIKKCHCCTCALATPDKVPSPEPWSMSMKRSKPKIDGYRCHASRPSQAGLPPTDGASFCPYYTDANGDQPLRHLVSDIAKTDGRTK